MERMCRECPAFFEVKEDGLIPTGGGWQNVTIDGKDVILCRPGKTVQVKRYMDRFCYYCLASVKAKKIGNKACWTGRTPKWCPLGREKVIQGGMYEHMHLGEKQTNAEETVD